MNRELLDKLREYKLEFWLIFGVFITIIVILIILYYIFKFNLVPVLSFVGSLFLAFVTMLGILINMVETNHNLERQFTQFKVNTILQIRYPGEKTAILKLKSFLIRTIAVYNHLIKVNDKEKEVYLSSDDFLLLQYLWIISNENFLFSLPLEVSNKLQKKFQNNQQINDKIERFKKTRNIFENGTIPNKTTMLLISEYKVFFKELQSKWEKNASFQLVYCDCMSKGIQEEELYSHFQEVLYLISNKKVEDFILEDNFVPLESPVFGLDFSELKKDKDK